MSKSSSSANREIHFSFTCVRGCYIKCQFTEKCDNFTSLINNFIANNSNEMTRRSVKGTNCVTTEELKTELRRTDNKIQVIESLILELSQNIEEFKRLRSICGVERIQAEYSEKIENQQKDLTELSEEKRALSDKYQRMFNECCETKIPVCLAIFDANFDILDLSDLNDEYNYTITFHPGDNFGDIIAPINLPIERISTHGNNVNVINKLFYGFAHIKSLRNFTATGWKSPENICIKSQNLWAFEEYFKKVRNDFDQIGRGFFSFGQNIKLYYQEGTFNPEIRAQLEAYRKNISDNIEDYFYFGEKSDEYVGISFPVNPNYDDSFFYPYSRFFSFQLARTLFEYHVYWNSEVLEGIYDEDYYPPLGQRYFYADVESNLLRAIENSVAERLDDLDLEFEF